MTQAVELRAEHAHRTRPRMRPLAVAAAAASLALGLAACDDNRDESKSGSSQQNTRQAQSTPPTPAPAPPRAAPDAEQPPDTSPGAAPIRERIVGTWTVTEAKAGSATAKGFGDKAEGTTYRFEDGGKVTVAGAKQCTYALQPSELKVDCAGTVTAGKIEFRDRDQTMVWSIGADESLTLKKR